VDVTAVREGFLREALAFAVALDIAADDDLGLRHRPDALDLSQQRPEPKRYC
jgi:hypothetical protein